MKLFKRSDSTNTLSDYKADSQLNSGSQTQKYRHKVRNTCIKSREEMECQLHYLPSFVTFEENGMLLLNSKNKLTVVTSLY